jgi:hypothetical protein
MPNWLPVDAGRLHRHMRALVCRQPLRQARSNSIDGPPGGDFHRNGLVPTCQRPKQRTRGLPTGSFFAGDLPGSVFRSAVRAAVNKERRSVWSSLRNGSRVAVDFESALTSTPDISLHRTKCREGRVAAAKPIKPVSRPFGLATHRLNLRRAQRMTKKRRANDDYGKSPNGESLNCRNNRNSQNGPMGECHAP